MRIGVVVQKIRNEFAFGTVEQELHAGGAAYRQLIISYGAQKKRLRLQIQIRNHWKVWVTVTETMELSVIAQGEKTVRGPMSKPCKGRGRKRSPGKRQKE